MTADSLDLDGCIGMKLIDSYKVEGGRKEIYSYNVKILSHNLRVNKLPPSERFWLQDTVSPQVDSSKTLVQVCWRCC